MLGGVSRRMAAPVARRFPAAAPSFLQPTTTSTTTPSPSFVFSPLLLRLRPLHGTAAAPMPLEEFRDPVSRVQRMQEPVGRKWSVRELRRKSYDDLHKLWYVLYKERNMLLTERQMSRRRNLIFPQPERIRKVKKSMGAIKHVLGERKRAHLARIKYARENGGAREPPPPFGDDSDSMEIDDTGDDDSTSSTPPTKPKQSP